MFKNTRSHVLIVLIGGRWEGMSPRQEACASTGRRRPLRPPKLTTVSLPILPSPPAAARNPAQRRPSSPRQTTPRHKSAMPPAPVHPPQRRLLTAGISRIRRRPLAESSTSTPPSRSPAGGTGGATQGAPNVLLIMTDDVGFGAPSTFGGVIPTPALDRIANDGAALHQFPLDRAVLADARRAHHRPQPSLRRLRRRLRAIHRLPRLQQHHPQGLRRRSARSSRTTATARRGSAKTTTRPRSRPARSARSTSGRPAWASSTSTVSSAATPASGSRTCSATRPRSTPTSASPAGT